jgi:hypothetical protein
MQCIRISKNQNSFDGIHVSGECIEKEPMHPDDFEAHLAWVTAKRFHELVLEKTCAKKVTGFYWITG